MLSDNQIKSLLIDLKKVKFTVHQEKALYDAIEFLSKKYKNDFFNWYQTYDIDIKNNYLLPEIIIAKNEMELDIQQLNETIQHPKKYTFLEISEFEKKVCDYLAVNLSRNGYEPYLVNEYFKVLKFVNRYEEFRSFYVVGFQIKYDDSSLSHCYENSLNTK